MEVRFQGETVESWSSGGRPERLVVFLHGSGDSGPGVAEWLHSLGARAMLDHKTAILFPSARERPYSLAGGESSRVWHDRRELNISAWEDQEGIARMADSLNTFISQVCQEFKLDRQKVILGGFRKTSVPILTSILSLEYQSYVEM